MRGIDVEMRFEKNKKQNFRLKNHDFSDFGSWALGPAGSGWRLCTELLVDREAHPGPTW